MLNQLLLDEITEYLALTDEQLAGYGLNRDTLLYQQAQLLEEENI